MTKHPGYFKLDKDKLFLISQKALIVDQGKVLLLKIVSGDKDWNGKWGLPGGLLEIGEELAAGLKRELKEETGLNIKIEKPISTGTYYYDNFILENGNTYKIQFVGIVYKCKLLGKKIKLSNEHSEYNWFSKNDLKKIKISFDSEFAIKDFLKNN